MPVPYWGAGLAPRRGCSRPESGVEGRGVGIGTPLSQVRANAPAPRPCALGWTAPSWTCRSVIWPLGGRSGVREGPPQTVAEKGPGWGFWLGKGRPTLCPPNGPLGDSGEWVPCTRRSRPPGLVGPQYVGGAVHVVGPQRGRLLAGALPPREAADVFGPGALSRILCSRQ